MVSSLLCASCGLCRSLWSEAGHPHRQGEGTTRGCEHQEAGVVGFRVHLPRSTCEHFSCKYPRFGFLCLYQAWESLPFTCIIGPFTFNVTLLSLCLPSLLKSYLSFLSAPFPSGKGVAPLRHTTGCRLGVAHNFGSLISTFRYISLCYFMLLCDKDLYLR